MDVKIFLQNWITASNIYNTEAYLKFYLNEAVLDDPSVGKKFIGHKGIQDYYKSYFIDYKTQTKLLQLNIEKDAAYVEVEFTGEFPEGKIKGTFEFTFKSEKILSVKANLI